MNRVGWAAAGAVAAVLGVSACGGDGADRKGEDADAVPASVMAAPGPEDSGPVTRAKMRVVLRRITAGVGAPPNDPDWARTAAEPRPGSLQECAVSYRAFEKAKTWDTKRTDALTAALIDRGWTKSPKQQKETDKNGTVYMTQSVFKKRGWTLVMQNELSHTGRDLKLTAFDDACVERATIDPSVSALLPAAQ